MSCPRFRGDTVNCCKHTASKTDWQVQSLCRSPSLDACRLFGARNVRRARRGLLFVIVATFFRLLGWREHFASQVLEKSVCQCVIKGLPLEVPGTGTMHNSQLCTEFLKWHEGRARIQYVPPQQGFGNDFSPEAKLARSSVNIAELIS